ncbi:unnamed protein product [Peniophora sp. CBMAI 1063]|nr:unnamed protein product [Peniophora sp. CBMAI 1063]
MDDSDRILYYLKDVPSFKHLPDPHAYHRFKDINTLPAIGDFVVCSIDPVASVAHLDEAARQAVRRMCPRRYIAFVMESHGLSIGHEPVNAYGFTFVRQGPPRATQPGQIVFRDYCIPVLSNTTHPTGRKPLRPALPLPWPDCYLDTHNDFNFTQVRVSSTPRDYTCVLPCAREEILDAKEMMANDCVIFDRRTDDMQEGVLEAIDAVALPPSPTSAFKIPLPPSPMILKAKLPEAVAHTHTGLGVTPAELDMTEDDVSIIASDDATSVIQDSQSTPVSDVDIGLLMHLETLFDTSGYVNDPVVDIWYDLDMVPEVIDPVYFFEERAQVRRIISNAEARLGITQAREEAAAKSEGFNPFRPSEVPNATVEAEGMDIPSVEFLDARSRPNSKSNPFARSTGILRPLSFIRRGFDFVCALACNTARAHDTLD